MRGSNLFQHSAILLDHNDGNYRLELSFLSQSNHLQEKNQSRAYKVERQVTNEWYLELVIIKWEHDRQSLRHNEADFRPLVLSNN